MCMQEVLWFRGFPKNGPLTLNPLFKTKLLFLVVAWQQTLQ